MVRKAMGMASLTINKKQYRGPPSAGGKKSDKAPMAPPPPAEVFHIDCRHVMTGGLKATTELRCLDGQVSAEATVKSPTVSACWVTAAVSATVSVCFVMGRVASVTVLYYRARATDTVLSVLEPVSLRQQQESHSSSLNGANPRSASSATGSLARCTRKTSSWRTPT